jgi:hypothetical protein
MQDARNQARLYHLLQDVNGLEKEVAENLFSIRRRPFLLMNSTHNRVVVYFAKAGNYSPSKLHDQQ